MKRRKERLHTYVVKSEKVAPDVLETPWIGSSKYEVSFLYALSLRESRLRTYTELPLSK